MSGIFAVFWTHDGLYECHGICRDYRSSSLDVLPRNRRAKALYTGMGFQYLHTMPMFYDDVGWTDFELYEYPLEESATPVTAGSLPPSFV